MSTPSSLPTMVACAHHDTQQLIRAARAILAEDRTRDEVQWSGISWLHSRLAELSRRLAQDAFRQEVIDPDHECVRVAARMLRSIHELSHQLRDDALHGGSAYALTLNAAHERIESAVAAFDSITALPASARAPRLEVNRARAA